MELCGAPTLTLTPIWLKTPFSNPTTLNPARLIRKKLNAAICVSFYAIDVRLVLTFLTDVVI